MATTTVGKETPRALLAELLERFREEKRGVRWFEFRRGEDWAGDPAIWVWVVLPKDAEKKGFWDWENREAIRRRIYDRFREAGFEDTFVYVRFRLENEGRAFDDVRTVGDE